MSRIIVLSTAGKDAPAPDHGEEEVGGNVLAGPIRTTTWNHFTGENGRLLCGIWEASPGTWKIAYTEWEFCHILEGKVVLTNEAGESWTLNKGDGFVIPPGFTGTWETLETVRKHYVILLPETAKS